MLSWKQEHYKHDCLMGFRTIYEPMKKLRGMLHSKYHSMLNRNKKPTEMVTVIIAKQDLQLLIACLGFCKASCDEDLDRQKAFREWLCDLKLLPRKEV